MVRECSLALFAVALTGCSLALDFSDKAIPIDAALDAPYTQPECDYGEPNDTADTAFVVTTTDSGPAAICASAGGADDHDFYKFTVPDGATSVTIHVDFIDRPTGDLDLRLFDVTGATKLAESVGFGNTESITCPGSSPFCSALAAGDYVFEVYPALAGSVNNYTFGLSITGP